ncbi:MAG: DnaD domain protein [Clostridiales bacterium]|nr:DnaD domain protein [Clostridiales bacterium]
MSFCTFSKDYNTNTTTTVDNKFIDMYLPIATGDAVKVYLYGLFVCKSDEEITLENFAKSINLDVEEVKNCFTFWEEFGVLNVISQEPFTVKYLPVTSHKPKKYNPEKYTGFNKALQVLIPDRMITPNEYSAYFSIMEEHSIKPEAMLLIIKYCVDLKGKNIGFKYILKVTNDFASRGITSESKIEKELSDYTIKSADLYEIFAVINPNGKPEIEDMNYYKKWIEELKFSKNAIITTATKSKVKSTAKLDKELCLLYSAKKFSPEEIDSFYKEKKRLTELAISVNKTLSVYTEVIEPVVENYIIPWTNKGYGEDALLFIANYCFRKNRRTLESMNDVVDKLYYNGLITVNAIAEFIKSSTADDEFIKTLLTIAGLSRRPTDYDRQSLKVWRSWNFSDEMITEAVNLSAGKNSPLSYVNAILSEWKTEGIFSIDKITKVKPSTKTTAFKSQNYTAEELNALIDDIDDIEF